MFTLGMAIGIGIAGFFIWQRKNKLIFGVMWALALLLFVNAFERGTPESLGRQMLQKLGELSPAEKATRDYYYGSNNSFLRSVPPTIPIPPKPQKSWFWWGLWLPFFGASLVVSILNIKDGTWTLGAKAWQGLKDFSKKIYEDHQINKRLKLQAATATKPAEQTPKQKFCSPQPELPEPVEKKIFSPTGFVSSITADATWDISKWFSGWLREKISGFLKRRRP